MKSTIKRRWVFGIVVFAVTLASNAQWSNPAMMFPPTTPPPAEG